MSNLTHFEKQRSERLLVAPWWGIHRDAIRDALLSEMSQCGNVVAVEVAHTHTYTHKPAHTQMTTVCMTAWSFAAN